jgi:hypothetical protein
MLCFGALALFTSTASAFELNCNRSISSSCVEQGVKVQGCYVQFTGWHNRYR